MEISKTVVQFEYKPVDYFESSFEFVSERYFLKIKNGMAQFSLCHPESAVSESLKKEMTDKLNTILNARMVIKHESYKVGSINVQQHYADGSIKIHRTITCGTGNLKLNSFTPDIILKDVSGNVVRDTKAERLQKELQFLKLSAHTSFNHPLIDKVFASYRSAVLDPADELVHLYEIIDALKNHYKEKSKALAALNISEVKWDRLFTLANNEPLKEGRHRGSKPNLRTATEKEMTEARTIAREIIEAVLSKLSLKSTDNN